MTGRLLLGGAGVALAAVGVVRLLDEDIARLWSLLVWLVGGVLAHDVVLAPLTLLVVAIGSRLVPAAARTATVVGLLVWGTVTLATANVLLGVGGRPDNPTLLERPYVEAWLVLSAVWWAGVVLVGALAVRRRGGSAARPPGDRRS